MKKVRVGVMGVHRGMSMVHFCKAAEDVEVVAICDKWEEGLERQKNQPGMENVTFYPRFDDFIQHDMDAVVLANYANEHAPFAIRCMNRGLHVFSEVLPVQTMKEAVELIETVERTGKIYAYGENYCFMPAPREMKKLYREGKIGEIQYAEGEYIHNCEPIWPGITYGDPTHWRNLMYANFYCTHSMGPMVHISGLRPVSVVGFESAMNAKNLREGSKAGLFGIEMVTMENGAIFKSIHGGLYKNSIWYTVYGSKGRMESAREDAEGKGGVSTLYINVDEREAAYDTGKLEEMRPEVLKIAEKFGHGGSDYYSMRNFIDKIQGKEDADTIDVYEAMDMFLPGMFAYRSVLNGGIPMQIPNLRDPAVREQYRNDTMCTDPNVAGDQLLPVFSKGNPDIPQEVYDGIRQKWLNNQKK